MKDIGASARMNSVADARLPGLPPVIIFLGCIASHQREAERSEGTAGDHRNQRSDERALPAAGIGLRYEASRQYGLNVSIDYARGRDSDAVYFYIGEAF